MVLTIGNPRHHIHDTLIKNGAVASKRSFVDLIGKQALRKSRIRSQFLNSKDLCIKALLVEAHFIQMAVQTFGSPAGFKRILLIEIKFFVVLRYLCLAGSAIGRSFTGCKFVGEIVELLVRQIIVIDIIEPCRRTCFSADCRSHSHSHPLCDGGFLGFGEVWIGFQNIL